MEGLQEKGQHLYSFCEDSVQITLSYWGGTLWGSTLLGFWQINGLYQKAHSPLDGLLFIHPFCYYLDLRPGCKTESFTSDPVWPVFGIHLKKFLPLILGSFSFRSG